MEKPHNFHWVESLQLGLKENRQQMREYEMWRNLGLSNQMEKLSILSSKLFFLNQKTMSQEIVKNWLIRK